MILGNIAPLAQRQEATHSNRVQCGFESHGEHFRKSLTASGCSDYTGKYRASATGATNLPPTRKGHRPESQPTS